VIGLIAAVTLEILDTSVVDVPTALLAAGAFLALNPLALEAHGGLRDGCLRGDRRPDPGDLTGRREVFASGGV